MVAGAVNTLIKLIIGLGNPGSDYARTRHNAGFFVVDSLAVDNGLAWKNHKRLFSLAEYNEDGIVLLKPLTYMNNSGLAVKEYCSYNSVKPDELLVVVDDFAIPFGNIRLRKSGSSGGHNGLKSITEHLGTQEFARLRLGIGPVPEGRDPADYVLHNFSKEESSALEDIILRSKKAITDIFTEGIDKSISKIK